MLVRSGPVRLLVLVFPPSPLPSQSSSLGPASLPQRYASSIAGTFPVPPSNGAPSCARLRAHQRGSRDSWTACASSDSGFSGCGSISTDSLILILDCKLQIALIRNQAWKKYSVPGNWYQTLLYAVLLMQGSAPSCLRILPRLKRRGWQLHSTGMAQVRHIITPRADRGTNKGATCQWITW